MKRVRYAVAMSLDGFIAGPEDQFDWIVVDPAIDFESFFDRFDVVVMGRRSYEILRGHEQGTHGLPGARPWVFSRTLRSQDHPRVEVSDDPVGVISELRRQEGKAIWLFGGGRLFRTLVEADLVDDVEVAVVPILLGGGVPMLPALAGPVSLTLEGTETFPSGIVSLRYSVTRGGA
jgi:dihydrofolate reductase